MSEATTQTVEVPPPGHTAAPAPASSPSPEPGQQPDARRDTIADVRAEAAQWRIRYRETETALSTLRAEQQQRVDEEKAKAAAEALRPLQDKFGKLQQQILNTEVRSALLRAGLKDADLVSMYTRCPDAGEVKVDDDFNVQGVDKMVAAFKTWKPDLFTTQQTTQTTQQTTQTTQQTTAGNEPPQDPGAAAVVDVRKMDKSAYATWKSEQFKKLRAPGAAGWGA